MKTNVPAGCLGAKKTNAWLEEVEMPIEKFDDYGSGTLGVGRIEFDNGSSITFADERRDLFAAAALQGLIGAGQNNAMKQRVAEEAWEYADAMLEMEAEYPFQQETE